MSKLVWDKVGEHWFEQGVQNGVLYVTDDKGDYGKGVAWNGLRSVDENPSGAESNKFYADNDVYLNILSKETYEATIGAYTYPDEWEECDGSRDIAAGVSIGQQSRKAFGFCYRTEVGNDAQSQHHYKLHIVYGCLASPSERNHETMNDSPSPAELSWTITTVPVPVNGFEKTATLEIDSSECSKEGLAKLLDILYGTDGTGTATPAVAAKGTVTFTGTAGATIPAGTKVSDGTNVFTTDADATIASGETTVDVAVTAVVAGAAANVDAATVTTIVDTVTNVTDVTNASAISGGADEVAPTDEGTAPRLPLPDEVAKIFAAA